MDDREIQSALQAEYLHIQGVIEGFDSRILTIKAWSVTFSLVAISGAFVSHASAVLLVAAVSALLFWYLEASWKTFQTAYYDRAEAIEAHFRGEARVAPFQIGNSWYRSWKTGGNAKLLRVLIWPHVALPHAAVAMVAAALFLLQRLGIVQM